MNAGIIINYNKKRPVELAEEITAWLRQRGVRVFSCGRDADYVSAERLGDVADFRGRVGFIIVLGGDGTLLSAARRTAGLGIPILGINLGTFGFLAEVEAAEVYDALEKVLAGDYETEDRMMLKCVLENSSGVQEVHAFNDFVLSKGSSSRMITFDALLDDELITSYSSDGIIVASPTGSTAYSLSAGGPIVYPATDVTVLVPICPHTLNARPLVVPADREIRLVLHEGGDEAVFTADGQDSFPFRSGDSVRIGKAEKYCRLIKVSGRGFFDIMRKKMSISGKNKYA